MDTNFQANLVIMLKTDFSFPVLIVSTIKCRMHRKNGQFASMKESDKTSVDIFESGDGMPGSEPV